MSGIANKVKDTLQSNKTSQSEDTYNTQNTSRTVQPADTRLDDYERNAPRTTATYNEPTYNTTRTTAPTGGNYTYGAAQPAYGSTGPSPGTDGPHTSDMMNKVDPRVDSDRDFNKNMGANPHGTADTGRNTTASTSRTYQRTPAETMTGSAVQPIPESHAPPVVTTAGTAGRSLQGAPNTTAPTSTAAHRNNDGFARSQPTTVPTSAPTNRGAHGGLTKSQPTAGITTTGAPEGAFDPHNTRAANAADPRVDSDLDSRNIGAGQTGHTTGTSTIGGAGTTGQITGSNNLTSGPAPNTAGPHKSDMMNKLDPRVDSNLDGSKTVGGNKTFAESNVDSTKTTH